MEAKLNNKKLRGIRFKTEKKPNIPSPWKAPPTNISENTQPMKITTLKPPKHQPLRPTSWHLTIASKAKEPQPKPIATTTFAQDRSKTNPSSLTIANQNNSQYPITLLVNMTRKQPTYPPKKPHPKFFNFYFMRMKILCFINWIFVFVFVFVFFKVYCNYELKFS